MRKSKKFKNDKENFEVSLITVKRMISIYSEKTIMTALLIKLKEIKDLIKDVEELKHLSELIIIDLPKHKNIFEDLSSVFSIDGNEIIKDEECMIKFSKGIIDLITREYIIDLMSKYNKNNFKVNSYLIGQETIADSLTDGEYSLYFEK